MPRRIFPFLLVLIVGACGGQVASTSTTTTEHVSTTSATSKTTTTTIHPSTSTTAGATTTTTAAEYDLIIEGGTAEDPGITTIGPDLFSYALGDEVSILVLSSVDDELHVHGYNLFFDLVAGQATQVTFDADIPGIFEAELEDNHVLLFELEVTP